MTIGLLLFSGWQWTSASDWFANPDSAPIQQEIIDPPNQQLIDPVEPTTAVRPTESLPTTELLLNDAQPLERLPEPSPTPIAV